MQKYPDDSKAAVQLNEEAEVQLLSYDDVSEFLGDQVQEDY